MVTAAYTAVVRAAAARDAAVQRTAGVSAARRALLEVVRALETSAPRPFTADAHGLRLARAEPEPGLVRYALEGSRLVESEERAFAAPGVAAMPPRVVLDAVQSFHVRCFDGGAWTDEWRGEAAPRAVELALQTTHGEELRTRVLLPLGGGG